METPEDLDGTADCSVGEAPPSSIAEHVLAIGAPRVEPPRPAADRVIFVTKAFVYSRKIKLANGTEARLPSEEPFTVGRHEIDEDMANDPWIRDHLADGKIESPEATRFRLDREEEQRQRLADEAEIANANAAAAMARAVSKIKEKTGADSSAIEKELNTPVSRLSKRGGGGSDADKSVGK